MSRARADGRARRVTVSTEGPRAWQRMLSGRRLDLLAPSPDDIAIEDMAHGLARVARWNGQTIGANPFSVAQHSLLVETLVGLIAPDIGTAGRLAALLHDGPEYVIGDLISPFKTVMDHAYKAVEHRLLAAIHRRFHLAPADQDLVALIKAADRLAAFLEATQLAGFAREEARRFFGDPPLAIERAIGRLVPLRAPAAERAFLARFSAITEGGGF